MSLPERGLFQMEADSGSLRCKNRWPHARPDNHMPSGWVCTLQTWLCHQHQQLRCLAGTAWLPHPRPDRHAPNIPRRTRKVAMVAKHFSQEALERCRSIVAAAGRDRDDSLSVRSTASLWGTGRKSTARTHQMQAGAIDIEACRFMKGALPHLPNAMQRSVVP